MRPVAALSRAAVESRLRGNDVVAGMAWGRGALRPVLALSRRLDSRLRGNDVAGVGDLGTGRVAPCLGAVAGGGRVAAARE